MRYKPVKWTAQTPGNLPVIVIGASAGGYQAVAGILKDLPIDLPASVVIAMHFPETRTFIFPRWLNQFARLPVSMAAPGGVIEAGHVYVAPPARQLLVKKSRFLVEEPQRRRDHCLIDRLLLSAAHELKGRTIGVILTGNGHDGALGLRAIHETGGVTIVQDPNEAEHKGMPQQAMSVSPVDFCLKLKDVGPTLEILARANAHLESGLAVALRDLRLRSALLVRLLHQVRQSAATRRFLNAEVRRLKDDIEGLEELVSRKRRPASRR